VIASSLDRVARRATSLCLRNGHVLRVLVARWIGAAGGRRAALPCSIPAPLVRLLGITAKFLP